MVDKTKTGTKYKRRTRRLTKAADFEKMGDLFEARKLDEEFLKRWNRGMRRPPQRIYDVLAADMPQKFSIEASYWVHSKECRLGFEVKKDGKSLMTAARSFDMEEKKVSHDRFVVTENARGMGIATVFLRNSMRLYKRMGIEKVTVMASMANGGYTWARFGFLPGQQSWERLQDRLKKRLSELEDKLPRRTYKLAEAALRQKTPKGLWIIADLAVEVDGVPLGKELLVGERWTGEMNLKDKDQMKRFWSYVRKAEIKLDDKNEASPNNNMGQLMEDFKTGKMIELEGDFDDTPNMRP